MKNLAFVLLLFIGIGVHAQGPGNPEKSKLQTLMVSLDSFRNRVPVEKVHMQFDKPYYSLGDTIWMKAYVVNDVNELSPLSKLLYVDLVNDKDSVKISLRLPLTKGLGWGAATLSDTLLRMGNYHIRAYTTLMRNFGEEYFFDRSIKIGNALPPQIAVKKSVAKNKGPIITGKDDPSNISIQFFPEGGDLVNNLITKIGFKAIGPDGLGREVTGYIAVQNNEQVTAFQSEHAGMGTFTIQPDASLTYTAVIKLADGTEKRINLPKAKDEGYGLSVTQTADNIIVNIQASRSLLNTGEISLIGQSNNVVHYTGKKELINTGFTAIIPKSRFPEGIAQFTLFSPQGKPVAERLIFIRNAINHLNIKLTPDKNEYNRRNKVNLNIAVTDNDGKPVTGSFSLAITDEGKVRNAEENEKTIFSNLLLTSDLKGYIEYPNYYFTAINADKDRQLDNLLLTQGWRRFMWNDLLNNTFPSLTYQAEKGRGISGRILTDKKGKPVPRARVTLLVNVGGGILVDTIADKQGRFNFDFPFNAGTTYNVAAADAKNHTDLEIEIDKQQTIEPVNVKTVAAEQPASADFATYLDNTRRRFDEMKKYGLLGGIMLKEVVINEYKKREDLKVIATRHSENLAGPGNADVVLTFMDILPHVNQGFDAYLNIKLMPKVRQMAGEHTLLVVDGIMGRDMPDPHDIAAIEFIKSAAKALYGMHGSGGVIIVTTKKGDIDYNAYEMEYYRPGSTKPQGLKTYTFQGVYDTRRQFYSPDYDNPATQTQIPDLRSTIYWNPNIITDGNGKASVKFFNADGTGNYRIITEGLDGSGKLGRQLAHYTVK